MATGCTKTTSSTDDTHRIANFGPVAPIGGSTGTVTVAGNSWNLHVGNNGSMKVYSFVSTSNLESFSADAREFFAYLEANEGYPAATQNLIGEREPGLTRSDQTSDCGCSSLPSRHRSLHWRAG